MSNYKDEKHGIVGKIDFDLVNNFFKMFKELDKDILVKNQAMVDEAIAVVDANIKINKNLAVKEWAGRVLAKSFEGVEMYSHFAYKKIMDDLVEYATLYEKFYSFKVSKAYVLEIEGHATLNVDVETIGTLSAPL